MKVFTLPGHAVLSIPLSSEQSFPVTNCYSTHTDHKIRDLPWRCIKQDSSTAFHFSFTLPSKMKEGGTNYYILSLMVFLLAGKISWVNFAGQPNLNGAFLRDKWIRKFFSYSGTFILFFKEKLGR